MEEYVGQDSQKLDIKQAEDYPLLVVETKTQKPRILFCTITFQNNIGLFKIIPTMVVSEKNDATMVKGEFVNIKPDKYDFFITKKDKTKFATIESGREFEVKISGEETKVVKALHGVFFLTERKFCNEKPLLIKINSSNDLIVCTARYDKLVKRFDARTEYVVRTSRESQEIYKIKGYLVGNDKYVGLKPTIENNIALLQPGTKANLVVTQN